MRQTRPLLAAALAALLLLLSLSSCGNNEQKYVWDYWSECRFEVPLQVKNPHYAGAVHFEMPMTLSQLCDAIAEKGYKVQLVEDTPTDCIFVTMMYEERAYYYVIYVDREGGTEVPGRFRLEAEGLGWREDESHYYYILAPGHIMDVNQPGDATPPEGHMWRVYRSFDYVAQYYRAAARGEDIVIDAAAETVYFRAPGNENLHHAAGWVAIRYVTVEDASYLEIKPAPDYAPPAADGQ